MHSTPIVFRSSFFGWTNPENTLFVLMEVESWQARIFINTTDETGTYWKMSVVIDGPNIIAVGGTTAEEAKTLLESGKHTMAFLANGPETISPLFNFGERANEEGKALWMSIDRKGVMTVENGIQRLFEELPSGLLQEIHIAPPEPENKLILES